MALNYWFEKIENYKEVVWIERPDGEVVMNPVTNALIFSTISVGLGEITDKNIDEFVARYRIMEQLQGPFITKNGKPYHLTDEELVAHIGLRTNVTNETRAQWARRLFVDKQTSITADHMRSFHRAQNKAAA